MNKKKADLTRIGRFVMGFYVLCVLIFTWTAWEQIQNSRIRGAAYPVVAAVLLILLILYFLHLKNCQKTGKKSWGLDFIETVRKYKFLMEQLVSRDFKIKYKRSILGVFWSFLNPLLQMVVQYVVFSKLFDLRGMGITHYAIYLLCGIIIWNGFNDCATQALHAITGNASLITKVYVPKYIYPVTKVLSAGVNLLFAMVPLLLVTLIYGLFNGLYLTKTVLLIPVALVFLIIFAIGMGFLLSSLMVFFHDVEFLWGVFSMMWMYATPIIYGIDLLRGKADWLVTLLEFNPMYHYVSFLRSIIIDGCSPALMEYVVCGAFSLGMLLIGALVFKKTQDKFILYI